MFRRPRAFPAYSPPWPPDAHLGLGATVGSVIPTLGAVIPAAVGVDIGCGMIAVRTQYAANWKLQLGSLGSGNHFIEVCADETDAVWLFLRSGSRGVGNNIAQRHIARARSGDRMRTAVLPNPALAYLEEGTPEFQPYIRELHWAQHFALLNREESCGSSSTSKAIDELKIPDGGPGCPAPNMTLREPA